VKASLSLSGSCDYHPAGMRPRLKLAACALLPAVLCAALWLTLPVGSEGAPAQDRLAEIQKKIEITRSRIGKRKGTERTLTSDISRWSELIGGLQRRIGALQTREGRLQADLDLRRAQLGRTQAELRSERARLARLRTKLADGRIVLARRMRELYEADRPDLITVVLNSDGFADLLERGEFLGRIRRQDETVIGRVRSAKADATATATRLDKLEGRQQTLTTAVLKRRDEVAGVKQELIDTRVGYQQTRDGKQAALRNVRTERHVLQENLDEMQAASARITAQLQSAIPGLPAGAIRQGSGQFIWPVNGPITGVFGEQRPGHIHTGLDIASPTGTPIRVADSGTVALIQGVGTSGGYGNFTCVAHSGSLSTCYAHQSSFGTSMGANVNKGDVIGYVGNTGHSFGAHLHFEVRVNGAPVNPMGYL
jgi:murein DD-endopeptidase MepM/ murein hydrolase activator NlpD